MKIILTLIVAMLTSGNACAATFYRDATESLLRCTYKIEGGGASGTAFVLLEPYPSKSNVYAFLLITAAHVLEEISSSDATLLTRAYDGTNFVKQKHDVHLRDKGNSLWTRHPSADVAVMRISFDSTSDAPKLSTASLATDNFFREMQITPSDQLRVIGYPLGFEGSSGFGIVRSAPIASFPLSPAEKIQTYLLDFPVFPGNSGGPVFMAESSRQLNDRAVETVSIFKITGLVSQELFQNEAVKSLTETTVRQHKLGLAVVVHSALVIETIALLPKLE